MGKSLVGFFVALILLIIGIFIGFKVKPLPTSPITTPKLTYCSPQDLQTSVQFQGAAGSILGEYTIKNTSQKTCKIDGTSVIQITGKQELPQNITITQEDASSAQSFILNPQDQVYARSQAQNGPQCSTAAQTLNDIHYSYTAGPNSTVTFEDSGGNTSFSIQVCSLQNEQTKITFSHFKLLK